MCICHSPQATAGILYLANRSKHGFCAPDVVSKVRHTHKGGCFSPDPSRLFGEGERPQQAIPANIKDAEQRATATPSTRPETKLRVAA